jgi:hypothetical protein
VLHFHFIADSSTKTERHSDTFSDKDPYMLERSKSNRKSKRKNSFRNDSKTSGLLQNTEWDQYEVIQKMILKDAPCGLQRSCDIFNFSVRISFSFINCSLASVITFVLFSLKRLTAFIFNCSVLSTPDDDLFLMADDLRYAHSEFFVFFAIVSSSCVLKGYPNREIAYVT